MKLSRDIPHFAYILIMVCLSLVPEGSNFFASVFSFLHFFSLLPKLEILPCLSFCDSMNPQHARLSCPSPTPGVHPNPCPLSWSIQPSHPLSSPSPPASNPSQHQSLFNEPTLPMRWTLYLSSLKCKLCGNGLNILTLCFILVKIGSQE